MSDERSNRLRAKIKDRRQKAGAYGRAYIPVCLDSDLINEYYRLLNEKTVLEKDRKRANDTRMSGDPEMEEVDRQLEELKPQIEEETVVLVFASMGDQAWGEFTTKYGFDDDDLDEETKKAKNEQWFGEMLKACFLWVEEGGERTDLTLDEILGTKDEPGLLSFGQAQEVRTGVQQLNLRRASLPFSVTTSRNRPKTSPTSKQRHGSGSATDGS